MGQFPGNGGRLTGWGCPAYFVAMKITDRQEAFIQSIVRDGKTQSDAYRAHYKCDGWTAQAVTEGGSKLAAKPHVAARIKELRDRKAKTADIEFDITVKKLLQTFFEIAFTDPNELISMRSGACRHCWGLDGAYHWKEREYAEALAKWQNEVRKWEKSPKGEEPAMPDGSGGFGYRFTADPNPKCLECEGEGVTRLVPKDSTKLSAGARHLYRGAQQTKDGLKILFADKDGALDKLSRILGAYDDRLRVDLRGQVAAIQLTTSDPVEAAREYEKMLAGGGN